MKIQLKYEWSEERGYKEIHHTGSVVGTLINVHYTADLSGMINDNNCKTYYVYWNDDNKEDEYFSDFEQVEYEIIKYLIKNRLEDGLQRIEGGK